MARIDEVFGTDLAFKADFLPSAKGDVQRITGVPNAFSSLIRRTITEPGTLVHRPGYGVGLKRFLNAPNNLDNQRELANRIKVQWEQDDRVNEVIGVNIEVDDRNPESIKISVRADFVGFQEQTVELIPFNTRVDDEVGVV